jgi:hypothetical protein
MIDHLADDPPPPAFKAYDPPALRHSPRSGVLAARDEHAAVLADDHAVYALLMVAYCLQQLPLLLAGAAARSHGGCRLPPARPQRDQAARHQVRPTVRVSLAGEEKVRRFKP